MFDTTSSVVEIASKCGFSSVSSFSRAFKATFNMSPGEWRKHDLQIAEKPYLKDPEVAAGYLNVAQRGYPNLKIAKHRSVCGGYKFDILVITVPFATRGWILKAWANSELRDFSSQFGLHHSNPAWVEMDQCFMWRVSIDEPIISQCREPDGDSGWFTCCIPTEWPLW